MKPPNIVTVHFLSTKWSKKLFTINHYEPQNSKCIVTQELSAYDYEALAAGSKTLQDQGAIFEECIDRMRQVIEGLPDVWEADTSKRYVEQFQEAEPGLRNVRQMIEDMAVQMQKISDNFAQADSDMAGQM
jgi:WXG100 family type VII secretion target